MRLVAAAAVRVGYSALLWAASSVGMVLWYTLQDDDVLNSIRSPYRNTLDANADGLLATKRA